MVKAPAPPIRPSHPPDEEPYIAEPNDIIGDVLRIVISMAPEFSHALARQIDAQARAAWGGDKIYIDKHSADSYSSRNAAIVRDYLAGERIAYLERKYGLSRAHIHRILKS
jgi:Mor family transcriptional regulator